MHVHTQPARIQPGPTPDAQASDAPGGIAARDLLARSRPGSGRRILHLLAAVVALSLAFAFAGQSVAEAATSTQAYKSYALKQLGGNATQFSCLDNIWTRESGWNPNAQNPSSTAYGIPQFLDSTWASTGIAKTSDGYRQIDAGLIYIDSRYGSPCGAWSHSQSAGWY